jgi:hypothetical protein
MTFAMTRRWVIFFTASVLFVLSQFYRASIAVMAPYLIRELGLNTRGLSLISASFFYAFAFMQISIGMYLDAIGPRIAMTALSILGAAEHPGGRRTPPGRLDRPAGSPDKSPRHRAKLKGRNHVELAEGTSPEG